MESQQLSLDGSADAPDQLTITKLNELYTDAESVDKDLFAEQRNNVLLVMGEHYSKNAARMWNNVRARPDLNQEQKIRLTKNHVQKIHKVYVNNVLSASPTVRFFPCNDKELRDRKSAELRQSVWEYSKREYKLKSRFRTDCEDFMSIGEIFTKIYFDQDQGDVTGYEALVDETGQPMLDDMGQAQPDETKPVMSGKFVLEKVYAFNVLRAPSAMTFEDSPYLIIRKMVDTKMLRARYKADKDKLKLIHSDQDKTYIVFDAQRGEYGRSKNQTLLREYYFRPCKEYPKGYYCITTDAGILEEGELPFGIFPIVGAICDQVPTTPRGRSPIRHMRPYQAEINRAASKIAEHQITLGDDKIIMSQGTKIEQGGTLPGVRGIRVSGPDPKILGGRDGSQYLNYANSQITELYDVMSVAELGLTKGDMQDVYAMMFKSASQKMAFSSMIERFEQYLIDFATVFMRLAQQYFPDNALIPMIGRQEYINIPEFRQAPELGYEIRVEAISEDIETRFGKQMTLTQALQYAGGSLDKDSIGKIIRSMPFADTEEVFSDLTIDYDLANNVIMALERGAPPKVHEFDNHEYMIKRITFRMRQQDFEMLAPQIQSNFMNCLEQHEQAAAVVQAKAIQAKSEYIPTGGAMVVCDLYVKDPANPNNSRRVRLPYDALNWLIQTLQMQGTSISQIDDMNPAVGPQVVDLASRMSGPKQSPAGSPGGSQPVQPSVGGNLPVMPGQVPGQ